jgi:hypothetical protein
MVRTSSKQKDKNLKQKKARNLPRFFGEKLSTDMQARTAVLRGQKKNPS